MLVRVRPYTVADAAATLDVFRRAIHTIAAVDYSPDHIEAWAPAEIELSVWARERAERNTAIADQAGAVVGFTDVDHDGYIDMLFVDPAVSRQGIASLLVAWATQQAEMSGARIMRTNASITARPFFVAAGFAVDQERHVVVRGVSMRNYAMSKSLVTKTPPSRAHPR